MVSKRMVERNSRFRGWPRIGLALRLALRGLIRAPGISFLAVSVLALGLAAPVVFFSILAGALRPLPVPGGDRVIRMEVRQAETGGIAVPVNIQDLEALRGAESLEAIGAFRIQDGTLVDSRWGAVRVSAAFITPEVLPLLRTMPVLGRIPGPDEAEGTLLLGFELWSEDYGNDPGVLGRVVELDGESRVITGVLPQGFGFPFHQNAWALLDADRVDDTSVELMGRLAEGVSLKSAQVELAGRWTRGDGLREPARRGGAVEVEAFTGGRGERGEGIAFLGLVLVALALLLIACANVANLLLVRATDRIRSLGVQSALGAGRAQLSTQLFLESLLLALVGGVVGLILAKVGVDALERALAAEHFGYFWMRLAVDGRVVVFASILVAGTAVFAGTLPIVGVLRADLHGVLKEGSGGADPGGGGPWLRVFVTTQLALSCAALVAAGLTGQSLAGSRDFGRGVPAGEILVASMDPGGSADLSDLEFGERLTALDRGLSSIPGAIAAALGLGAPGYFEPWSRFEVEGEEAQRIQDRRGVIWNAVTPGYFSLFNLDVLQGRGLQGDDGGSGPPVAVVNVAFAGRYLPRSEPLGRRLRIVGADSTELFTVVGVVEDVDMGGGPRVPKERVYLPLREVPGEAVLAMVRSGGDPAGLTPSVRQAVAAVDPGIPLWSVRTLAHAYAYVIRVPRAMASLALSGGLCGLVVAAVGLYGLLTFRVRRRRKEYGIRLALGANRGRLAGEILKLALGHLLPALAVGLLLAWLISPVLGAVLLGLNPRSPATYAAVAGAFLTVGLVAALFPALRVARVDPSDVLRNG